MTTPAAKVANHHHDDVHEEPPRFSVVVPCYNEEGAVAETIDELRAALGDVEGCELLMVNDGSSDRTGEILHELAAKPGYPVIRVIDHDRNLGYGAALKTGIRRSDAPLIVITDADGTYPNHRIPGLVEEAHDADMIVGSRTGPGVTYSKIRKIPKIFLRAWVSWIAGVNVPDMNSGLRVLRREVVLKFLKVLPDTFSFTTTITLCMLCNRYRVKYIPITYNARVGNSKIKPIRDTLRFTQLILRTGMYFAPLRVLMPFSVVLSLGFAASAAFDVYNRDLTDKTIILLLFAMNTGLFALIADMIDKRSPS